MKDDLLRRRGDDLRVRKVMLLEGVEQLGSVEALHVGNDKLYFLGRDIRLKGFLVYPR